jgi:hypothetical protein
MVKKGPQKSRFLRNSIHHALCQKKMTNKIESMNDTPIKIFESQKFEVAFCYFSYSSSHLRQCTQETEESYNFHGKFGAMIKKTSFF